MSEKSRVYIVDPYSDDLLRHVQQVRMLFFSWGWEVKKISPDDRSYHENCIVLLPDTGGLNACELYCLEGGTNLPPHVRPQDQGIEWFRLKTLHYYVQKGIPVLGLGYSSYLTFAEVLRGQLIFGPDGITREAAGEKLPYKEDTEGFKCFKPHKVCGGLDAIQPHLYGEELIVLADELLKYHGKGGRKTSNVLVPVPTSPNNRADKLIP